jgi:hypothetical protein
MGKVNKYKIEVTLSVPVIVDVKASSLKEANNKAIKQAKNALILFGEDSGCTLKK